VVRVREVGKVIGPVREVKREILVPVPPVVADTGIALDNEGSHAECFESSSDVKTADSALAKPVESDEKWATHQ
jgi:hypothetical protein